MRIGSRLGLGAICLDLVSVGLVLGLAGHIVSSRRFVQAGTVHTVAAVRAILTRLTSTTFVAKIYSFTAFYSFIYLFIIKRNYVMSVFFVIK